jgi:hypothetical protein
LFYFRAFGQGPQPVEAEAKAGDATDGG